MKGIIIQNIVPRPHYPLENWMINVNKEYILLGLNIAKYANDCV